MNHLNIDHVNRKYPGISPTKDYALLKSFLQKSIRRNHTENATKAMFDCLLIPIKKIHEIEQFLKNNKLEEKENKSWKRKIASMKGVITNSLNRFKIICCEDISLGNPFLIEKIEKKGCFKRFSDYNYYSKKENFNQLIQDCLKMVYWVTDQSYKKIRFPSYLRAAFYDLPRLTEPQIETLKSLKNSDCSQDSKKSLVNFYNNQLEVHQENIKATNVDNFKKYFKKKNIMCFSYYLDEVFTRPSWGGNKKKSFKFEKESILRVKKMINFAIKEEDNINKEVYFDFFNNVKQSITKDSYGEPKFGEFWIFGIHVIAQKLFAEVLEKNEKSRNVTKDLLNNIDALKLFKNHCANPNYIIPEYCKDIHTMQGKNKGKMEFITNGSHVENELFDICENGHIFKKIYELLPLIGYKSRKIYSLTEKSKTKKRSRLTFEINDENKEEQLKNKKQKSSTTHSWNGNFVDLDIGNEHANNDLEKKIKVFNACRELKPCNWKNPQCAMTFFAEIISTGEKIILKRCQMGFNTETGVPDQCVIDEHKDKLGLERIETMWIKSKTKYRHNDFLKGKNNIYKWSTNDSKKSFHFYDPENDENIEEVTYILMKDKGFRNVLKPINGGIGPFLKPGGNGGCTNEMRLEIAKISFFRFAYTSDNALVNCLTKNGKILSIDEEKFNRQSLVNSKKKKIKLDEYIKGRMKSKLSKNFFEYCAIPHKKELIEFVKLMKTVNDISIFDELDGNINAISTIVSTLR